MSAHGNPTRPTSNMLIGRRSFLMSRPCTTRFVLVPMSEQVPPKIERNESGIKSREGEIRFLRHQVINTGTSIATFGVLFSTIADGTSTAAIKKSAFPSVSTRPKNRSPTYSITPVSRNPAATTKRAATVSIAEFEKPLKA